MTIRVELNPETEARLKAEARAKGLPLEKVAEGYKAMDERRAIKSLIRVGSL